MNAEPRILIVDDEQVGRDSLQVSLTAQGYELAFAASGAEALATAAELSPDLILLDVMMPGMDGFEVCRRLRADPHLAEVPILLITALDDRESRLQGLEAGADDFLSKPFDRTELRARVRTITRLDRYRRLLVERTQRERAEEAERLKDQFISNVSHELRTPLSIITLLSGNLDTLYGQLAENKRRQMIRDIRRHAQTLDDMIGKVLDISRIENKRILIEQQRVDLAQLARQEAEQLLPLAQRKSLTLNVTGDQELGVQANESQLRQVISNLLSNAIKYTPDGGQITCECRLHTAAEGVAGASEKADPAEWPDAADLPAGRWAALRVSDTGVGIGLEHLPHLFERFYRVQAQGVIPGAGLGLSIVKELVELHGGRIAVASTPGRGSVFAVYVPLANGAPLME
ncbi:MAG: response regulator [Thermoflexales bacterium]|nr:response regulator [Thermoflexales bacterium]